MAEPIQLTDGAQLKEKIASGVAVVQFHATWCKDCIYVKPLYRKLVKESKNSVCIDVDVDKAPQLKAEYKVAHVPTFILYHNGVEQQRIVEPKYEQLEDFMSVAAKL
ncbi:thioredoxin H-type, putative [Entamoeba invadens IP1]|uniref:Thioredoxin H-type, putative n=1 Tax=Entamoeba invadens IP1 TaxID=370355 RepID=A0A0A1UG34_ENTIV|nr:thioredoxin H-type, putative [Entamoeba invadens IP1]XP_004258970.1 thioredoxin H-type, putative [Entamoeba invadens IP1]ELP92170.1 thioredoxin H-type, putative [Entamoeba invadens IP1]ELP92199.1 thioredoxin H-type, putative [Entamoeba invadens IP1]|eukprot:XP_004258941.1 thioredoxin H-type, putative [Entamoeba invadens IP1]